MTESDELLDRILTTLREPVYLDPGLTDRVMATIATDPALRPVAAIPRPRWWQRRWTISLSPLGGLAAAACLTGIVGASMWARSRSAVSGPTVAGTSPTIAGVATPPTQFVLVAPAARVVSVVGDFNDWNLAATPLAREAGGGVWWVTVPLTPGRYRYAFVVDGTMWRPDPDAPAAPDEFGRPNSVVTIGGL